jgi:hypothetical protein
MPLELSLEFEKPIRRCEEAVKGGDKAKPTKQSGALDCFA